MIGEIHTAYCQRRSSCQPVLSSSPLQVARAVSGCLVLSHPRVPASPTHR